MAAALGQDGYPVSCNAASLPQSETAKWREDRENTVASADDDAATARAERRAANAALRRRRSQRSREALRWMWEWLPWRNDAAKRLPPSNPANWPESTRAQRDARPNRIVMVNRQQTLAFCDNFIKTSKYEWFSFFPKFLAAEFSPQRKIANVYFLVIAAMQMVPQITNTFGMPIVLLPLGFIVLIDMLFAILEDMSRHRADKRANAAVAHVLDSETAKWRRAQRWQVAVGDLVKIYNREEVPADMVLVAVHEPYAPRAHSGVCYVETKSLDGETNLKMRHQLRALVGRVAGAADMMQYEGRVVMEHPNKQIERFASAITLRGNVLAGLNRAEEPRDGTMDSPPPSATKSPLQCALLPTWSPGGAGAGAGGGGGESKGPEGQPLSPERGVRGGTECSAAFESLLSPGFASQINSCSEANEPIAPDNLLLRGTVLRNTKWAIGLAVNTGHDTKLMMAMQEPEEKASKLNARINSEFKYIALMMVALCVAGGVLSGIWVARMDDGGAQWYLEWGEDFNDFESAGDIVAFMLMQLAYYVLLLYGFIPISLYVTQNFVRFFQAKFMNMDLDMYHEESGVPARVRSMNINEDLGQISHIFSDKTGTLTCNVMDFRKCSINGRRYGRGLTEIGVAALKLAGKEIPAEVEEAERLGREYGQPHVNFYDPALFKDLNGGNGGSDAVAHQAAIDDFMTTLALCHTVIPERVRGAEQAILSASSPDDEALVLGATYFGFEFADRVDTKAVLVRRKVVDPELRNSKAAAGAGDGFLRREEHEVLKILGFTSDRKRMSVVVRTPAGTVRVLTKGADTTVSPLLSSDTDPELLRLTTEHMDDLGREGLRTLMVCAKDWDSEDFARWDREYEAATNDVTQIELRNAGQANDIDRLAAEAEKDLCLLGATAIEDKLQGGVGETVDKLLRAGITMWMITGDKEETAVNIAVACQLLWSEQRMERVVINTRTCKSAAEMRDRLLWEHDRYEAELAAAQNLSNNSAAMRTPTGNDAHAAFSARRKRARQRPSAVAPSLSAAGPRPRALVIDGPALTLLEEECSAAAMAAARRHKGLQRRMVPECEVSPRRISANNSAVSAGSAGAGGAPAPAAPALAGEAVTRTVSTVPVAVSAVSPAVFPVTASVSAVSTEVLAVTPAGSGVTEPENRPLHGRPAGESAAVGDIEEPPALLRPPALLVTPENEVLASNNGVCVGSGGGSGVNVDSPVLPDLLGRRQSGRLSSGRISSGRISVGRLYSSQSARAVAAAQWAAEEGPAEEEVSARDALLQFCHACRSVVGCRMSPDQKRQLVRLVREHVPDARTLAIGDGANDVPMIQAAHVGVGISGQEGLQAANASDYSFGQFRFLQKLLLCHGRFNYWRMSFVTTYLIYKSVAWGIPLFTYAFWNGMSGMFYYEYINSSLWAVVYTSLPIILFGVYDMDVSPATALRYPCLYRVGLTDNFMRPLVFWGWILQGALEGVWIAVLVNYTLEGAENQSGANPSGLMLGQTAFCIMTLAVNGKMFFIQKRWHWVEVVVLVGSTALLFAGSSLVSNLGEMLTIDWDFYGIVRKLQRSANFWLVILLGWSGIVMRDLAWKGWHRWWNPKLHHLLAEMEIAGLADIELPPELRGDHAANGSPGAGNVPAVSVDDENRLSGSSGGAAEAPKSSATRSGLLVLPRVLPMGVEGGFGAMQTSAASTPGRGLPIALPSQAVMLPRELPPRHSAANRRGSYNGGAYEGAYSGDDGSTYEGAYSGDGGGGGGGSGGGGFSFSAAAAAAASAGTASAGGGIQIPRQHSAPLLPDMAAIAAVAAAGSFSSAAEDPERSYYAYSYDQSTSQAEIDMITGRRPSSFRLQRASLRSRRPPAPLPLRPATSSPDLLAAHRSSAASDASLRRSNGPVEAELRKSITHRPPDKHSE